MQLPIYHISKSEANGPGKRLVVWVQGCRFNCKNCFNPETHPFLNDRTISTEEIMAMLSDDMEISGVTFSGGEPLEYEEALLEIIERMPPRINSIVFSGYTLDEILSSPSKIRVIKRVDLSIIGRYNDDLPHPYAGKTFIRTSGAVDLNYFKRSFSIEYCINGTQITKSGIFKRNKHN